MNHERTLQEAARRYARLQRVHCTNANRAEAQAWRESDRSNQHAAEIAQRVVAGIDQMAAHPDLGGKLQALADEAFAAYAPATFPVARTRTHAWKLGAGLAASIALAAVAWQISSVGSRPQIEPVVYETHANERRSITLIDGSVVELDVGTQIAVRIGRENRQITLLDGRALFDVAHDSSRPFTVSAGGSRTTALGTQFQVQRDAQRVVVTLAEGSVSVEGESRDGSSAVSSWQERLRPGDQLNISFASAERNLQVVDTQLVTSWTHGRHVFRGTPLQEALHEVNRYARRKVRLGDPSLADLPVAGNFVTGDSDVVVDALAAVLPLRVVHSGDQEIILFRRYGP